MKKYFIPIIGTISSGKTTFLNAFLGIKLLQTGSTTTTKFVCLIKNSKHSLFYHVKPKKQANDIIFEKEGEETKGDEQIKEKIKEINLKIAESKDSINDIFYMLEIPIKNINNNFILENCYFMDIPGLNEGEKTYIKDIFSLISFNDILFEIMIFDSTNIGSDNISKILNSLQDNNVLSKENNLFILNKIDLCSKNGEENILDTFKKYFYKTFEEGQNIENPKIEINIYKNYFIPMNSVLYLSETKINNDFTSLLIFESYNYMDNYKSKYHSYYEFIKNKLEFLIRNQKVEINKETKKLDANANQTIKNSIEYLKYMYKGNSDINLGLAKKSEKDLKNMYALYLLKKYPVSHSESYNKILDFINNINTNNNKEEEVLKPQNEQEKINYAFYTEETKQKGNLSLTNKNNNLLIQFNFENSNKEYEKEFSIEEILKLNKFFSVFGNINKIIQGIKEIFNKN